MAPALSKWRAPAYCAVWYLSILAGFYALYAPLLPLLLLHRPLYRRASDVLFNIWETFNVSLMSTLLGVRLRVTGDPIFTEESALLLSNHRTRLDWNFLWAAVFHAGRPTAGHNVKLVLKEEVKAIPGIGWIMQMFRCIYIRREWKSDEGAMRRMVRHLSAADTGETASGRTPFQVLLFPEGTDLTPKSAAKSNAYAEANNWTKFKHVLHPRTTGFSFLADEMRKSDRLEAVYDVTVAYRGGLAQRERDLVEAGEETTPDLICFHIKRYGVQELPTTLIGLDRWLQERWAEKERLLEAFHNGDEAEGVDHVPFPAVGGPRQAADRRMLPAQYLSLVSWSYFLYWFVFHFCFSWSGLTWIAATSAFMFAASKSASGGLHEVEVALERMGTLRGAVALALGKAKEE